MVDNPYGIPHIYGQSEEDVYFALGYVHAKERLFQMEMLRRVAAGRLAEILGEKLVKTDKFFRTIGILKQAKINAAMYFNDPSAAFQKAALAYLAGINQFVEKGETPIEFRILGIPREKFTPKDIYLTGSKDEPLGFYDFSQNPQSENPPSGFVYSANNQPETISGTLYPGYYVPEDRARRILEYLESDTIWSIKAMKHMNTDCISPVAPEVTEEILKTIKDSKVLTKTSNHAKAYQILKEWNGDHQITDVAPTIYYKLLSYILENTFADELGDDDFKAIVSSPHYQDQAVLFNTGKFRKQMMNRKEIERFQTGTLIISPG